MAVSQGRRGAAGISSEQKPYPQVEKRSSRLSLAPVSEIDGSSVASFSSSTDMDTCSRFTGSSDADRSPVRNTSAKGRQRRISVAVFQNLKNEGKKRKNSKARFISRAAPRRTKSISINFAWFGTARLL